MAYNPETDYSLRIKQIIDAGGRASDVQRELDARIAKATSTPGLEKYAYDDVYKLATDYINKSKPTANVPTTAKQIQATRNSRLKGAKSLSELYGGITFDEGAILDKFNAATDAEYALKSKEAAIADNNFYRQTGAAQASALDAIRKNNAQAIATGASRGIQAANELSTMLGFAQETTGTATELAQKRNLMADEIGAAKAKNALNAFNAANAAKMGLANLDAGLYAADTQFDVGQLQYYVGLNQAEKALEGTKYAADKNYAGNVYTSDNALKGSQYAADKGLAGAQAAAGATRDAATANADAIVEAARQNKLGMIGAAEKNAEAQTAYYNSLKDNIPADQQKTIVQTLDEAAKAGNEMAWKQTMSANSRFTAKEIDEMWNKIVAGGTVPINARTSGAIGIDGVSGAQPKYTEIPKVTTDPITPPYKESNQIFMDWITGKLRK